VSVVVPITAAPSARASEPLISRGELERAINRGTRTIRYFESEGMPVAQRAAGGNAYRLADVKAWLINFKGWRFEDLYGDGCTHPTEYGGTGDA
jgi:hypothetical protein